MDRLWAPWRSDYVADAGSRGECFLCAAVSGDDDRLVVARDRATVSLLNAHPYNPGHILVAPNLHIGDLLLAGDDTAAAVMVGARRAMRALQAAMHSDGFNVGVNQGESAGASVEHLHVHVVPRWSGDTNFMPVVGETKVLPESLEDTVVRLRAAFDGLA